jgi:hypothetical protein
MVECEALHEKPLRILASVKNPPYFGKKNIKMNKGFVSIARSGKKLTPSVDKSNPDTLPD